MVKKRGRTIVRLLGLAIGMFASFFAVLLLILMGYLLSSDYTEQLRLTLEAELTQLSGAPATVRGISLDLPHYAFELRGIELGAPGREGPVLELDRVQGKLRLSELLNLRLQWSELVFDGLTVTLVEDADRGLRFPSGPADPTPLGGITLAADRISVVRAVFVISNEDVPWTLEGQNLSLEIERLRDERYQGKFAYEEGSLRIKDHEEIEAAVTADFEIVPHEFFLREGRATSDFGSVRATGKLGLAGGVRARFELEGEGDAGRTGEALLGIRDASTLLEGKTSFRGTLSIEPGAKTLEGTLLLPEGRIASVPLAGWKGEVFWDRSILQIGYAQGTLGGGVAKLQLHQPLPIAEHQGLLDVDVEGAWLSQILSGVSGAATPVESLISGRGSFHFPGDRPRELEGTFELAGIEPMPYGLTSPSVPLSFHARGSVGEELRVEELQFRTAFLEGTLAGTYPRTGPAFFSIDVVSSDLAATDRLQRELRELAASESETLSSTWGVSGSGSVHGQLTERLPDFSFRGELTAEDLRIDAIPLGSIRADVLWSGEEVRFEDLVAQAEGGSLAGRGVLSLVGALRDRHFDLDLTLSRWPAAELADALGAPYPIQGFLSGDIDARRMEGVLDGAAELELIEGRLFDLDFERGKARLRLDGARVALDPVTLVHAGSALEGRVDLDFQDRGLTGAFRASGFPLGGIGPEWAALGGAVDAEIAFSGLIEKPVAELTGRGQGIRLAGLELGEAFLSGSVREGGLDLVLTMERQAAELVLESKVELGGDYPATGRVRWNGIDAAPWFRPRAEGEEAPVPMLRVTSNGAAEFRGELGASDALKAMEVDAEVRDFAVESESYRVASLAPVRLHLRDAELQLERVSIEEAGSRLAVSGSLDLVDDALDIEASGVASLGLLSSFYSGLATTGETTLSAAITGTLDRPSITGYADFDGGSVRLEGFRQALGGLKGRMVFDNRTIRIPELHAVFGSGPVEISGTIALEGLRPGSVDLTLKGSGIRLRYPDGLNATLEGELALLGGASERMLSGSLVLRDALWTREYDLVSGILSDREGSLFEDFAGNEILESVRLDVAIRAPQSLQVRNSLATIGASADLELRGTLGHPILLGRSVADHGDIFFLGQRYQITSGTVDFVNPEKLEPFVDLTAETRVRSYRVELRLTGTPDRFQPELSSDPPLRTVDILRLLAGATERELLDTLVGTEAEELAGVGVASLLTERLSQEVGRRAERLFGLDRFSVNPFLVGQFANPTARVSLGKQISRELSINYSTNLNAATEAIILIEYTPEGPMSWILSRDEEGDVGVDVKFRKSF